MKLTYDHLNSNDFYFHQLNTLISSWKVQLFDEERKERVPARGLPSRVLKAFSASTLTKLLDFKCK